MTALFVLTGVISATGIFYRFASRAAARNDAFKQTKSRTGLINQ